MVKRGQEKDFARLRAKINPNRPVKAIRPKGLKLLVDDYKACLSNLKAQLDVKRKPRPPEAPPADHERPTDDRRTKTPPPPPDPRPPEPFGPPTQAKAKTRMIQEAFAQAGFSLEGLARGEDPFAPH